MYERTNSGAVDRAASKITGSSGVVAGILATDGEASDGHILNIAGGETQRGAPLLFAHDEMAGNLGSWTEFDAKGGTLRGSAQIELGGVGERAEWRQDVAHMVQEGHIGAFSIRWDPVGEPTARTALHSDHPAFVDPDRETEFRKLYGFYFDKWRMLEGSIVTLPADQAALIGRARSGDGTADYWNRVLARMAGVPMEDRSPLEKAVGESFANVALDELEPIELADGRVYYLPSELADRLRGEGVEEMYDDSDSEMELQDEGETLESDGSSETLPNEPDVSGGRDLTREDITELMREQFPMLYEDARTERQAILETFRGEIADMRTGFLKEATDLLYEALGVVKP